jgi:hypothetical protein
MTNIRNRYLYEREHYTEAGRFMETALEILAENDTLMFASAVTFHGLIELNTNNVQTALDAFLATDAWRSECSSVRVSQSSWR